MPRNGNIARLMLSALFLERRKFACNLYSIREVPGTGLEPAQLSIPDPKSGASTNSAIRAFFVEGYLTPSMPSLQP